MSDYTPPSVNRRSFLQSAAGMFGLSLAKAASAQESAAHAPKSKRYARIPDSEIAKHIDRAWIRKSLINDLLDHWLTASVMPSGFIQENLDRKWQPWGSQREATINGQGRVLYTLAIGYEITGQQRYLDAINKAADFLLKMHDDQNSGYFDRMTPDLKLIDGTKSGYQSFAMFSLAHAGRVTGNQRYTQAAMTTFHELKAKMSDGKFIGGSFTRDFSATAPMPIRLNATAGRGAGGRLGGGLQIPAGGHRIEVHMFEALLGLYAATKSKEVWDTITAEMDMMTKMYDYNLGYLSQIYDADWKPTGTPGGNTGHLFEWASLLSYAVELGADPKFIELGSRNIDLGLKAYNKEVGGLGGRNDSGAPSLMLWWPQCEVIKATAHYAVLRGRSDLWPYHHQTLDFVKKTYLDPEYGGWFEGYIPGSSRVAIGERAYIKGAVDGPELSPYHMTSMFHDLWRITDPRYKA